MPVLQLFSSFALWICGSTVKHKLVYSTAVTPELSLEVTLWECKTPSAVIPKNDCSDIMTVSLPMNSSLECKKPQNFGFISLENLSGVN